MGNPTILLTNDDGIDAEGLRQVRQAVCALGAVLIVAPDRQRSAIGHAITLETPVRIDAVPSHDGCRAFSCTGTPTDCVWVGVHGVLGRPPELLISGCNEGANMGEDLTYSGTVCAAMEGAIMSIPSIALSVAPDPRTGEVRYQAAAAVACGLARLVLRRGLPRGVFLNVNVPSGLPGDITGVSITRLGYRDYELEIDESANGSEERVFVIRGAPADRPAQPGTDIEAISHGRVSITPVSLDMTASAELAEVAQWPLEAVLGSPEA